MKYRLVSWRKGYKEYLSGSNHEHLTTRKDEAWIVSEKTADLWPELEREEIAEDEAMKLAGAPTLPGLEL